MSDFAIGSICLTIIAVVAALSLYLDQRRAERRALAPAPALGPNPTQGPALLSRLRKLRPYLFFIALGAAMLYGHQLLLWLTSLVHHAPDVASTGPNATGAEIAAAHDAGGWGQAGAVTSKLIAAGGAYLFMRILRWKDQGATHPEPTRWAKDEYTADFKELLLREKFEVYGGIRLRGSIDAAAALVFGAFFQ